MRVKLPKPIDNKAWKRSRRWWPSKRPEVPSPYVYAWRIVTRRFYEEHCYGKLVPCPYYHNVRSEEGDTLRVTCKNRTYNAISNDMKKSYKEVQRELEEAYTCPFKDVK